MPNINTAKITKDDLKKAETSDLLALYNKMTGKEIKGFHTRTTGEEQVWKLIEQLAPNENVWDSKDFKEKPKDEPEVAKKKAAAVSKQPKEKKPSKREVADHRVIRVLIKENPKRPGSRAFDKFALLMGMDGKTVGEYKALEGQNPKIDNVEKGWAATEIRWALKQEWIKLLK